MKAQKSMNDKHNNLIDNLVDLVEKGNAHASLDDALESIPFQLLGTSTDHLPYTIWQLAEHIRIAQWDILEFSRNAKHISPKWPEGYWPKEKAPASKTDWQKCVESILKERGEFVELIKKSGDTLYDVFEHGDGQSLLKEALVLADHNSYHTGELIIMRRLLNAWKSK